MNVYPIAVLKKASLLTLAQKSLIDGHGVRQISGILAQSGFVRP